ncbi:MAG: VOC family protein [bacterium]|nr:VOC family protein [bacterium]
MNLQQLLEELQGFEERIIRYLTELKIQDKVQFLFVDHLCVRLKDINNILLLKKELGTKSKIISSAIVNEREIIIYKLDTPVRLQNWFVPCIELPYPKPGHSYPDGWEHIEIVFPSSAKTIEGLRTDFQNYFPEINMDTLKENGQYSEEVPKSESDQLPNPSIVLRKNKNTAIKFHAQTIEKVVS